MSLSFTFPTIVPAHICLSLNATCPTQLNILTLITLTTFGQQYRTGGTQISSTAQPVPACQPKFPPLPNLFLPVNPNILHQLLGYHTVCQL
jgi:hypothetical protein